MTTTLSVLASFAATIVPGLLISPQNPGTVFGFAVVGFCMLLAVQDYVQPRRLTRHGLRA